MPIEIEGVTYYSAPEAAAETGISRQTLWRWRQQGKVPLGLRFRDRKILFTTDEFEEICDYANRLEPASTAPSRQGNLFGARRRES
jgi:hypothetical protein